MDPHKIPVPVRIWKIEAGQAVLLFQQDSGDIRNGQTAQRLPFDTLAGGALDDPVPHKVELRLDRGVSDADMPQCVIVEAAAFRLTEHCEHWTWFLDHSSGTAAFYFVLQSVECQIEVNINVAHLVTGLIM